MFVRCWWGQYWTSMDLEFLGLSDRYCLLSDAWGFPSQSRYIILIVSFPCSLPSVPFSLTLVPSVPDILSSSGSRWSVHLHLLLPSLECFSVVLGPNSLDAHRSFRLFHRRLPPLSAPLRPHPWETHPTRLVHGLLDRARDNLDPATNSYALRELQDRRRTRLPSRS